MTWFVLAAVLILIGAWAYLRSAGSATAFFAASRTAGPIIAGLGGTAAGLSAFVFIGGPGLFAAIGVASLWIILSAPLTGALQCWAVGEPIVAMVRRHGCLTVPDIVACRFGEGWPRGLAAVAVVAGSVATLAVQVKGVAVAGEVLLAAPGWMVAAATVAAVTLYAATGGMRAGLPAEAAQGLVMAVAAVGIAWVALSRAGGIAEAVSTLQQHRPELLAPWGPVGATAAIGWFLLFGLGTCAQPHYLQKFLLLRDAKALRWLPMVMTAALVAMLTVWVGLGLGGTALWLKGELVLSATDELSPALLKTAAGPWLAAVALVAVVAAVMSTAATLLNLVAAALVRDLPRAMGLSVPTGMLPARLATVAAAVAAAGLALASERPVALLGVLGWGTFVAALLPAILVGLNWPGATRAGAVAAMALGTTIQIGMEAMKLAGIALRAWEPGLTGASVGAMVLVLASLITRPAPDQLPEEQ